MILKCPQSYWNVLHLFDFVYFVLQIFWRKFLSIFHTRVPLRSSWCNLSWEVSVNGLHSGKFLSLYIGPFSCKVQILEKDGACLFVVQHFVYSNESLGEEWLFFTFLSWGINFLRMWRKYAYLNKNLQNTMKLLIFVFVGNPINKSKVVLVWKGYYSVTHFSIIGNFNISMYPVYY